MIGSDPQSLSSCMTALGDNIAWQSNCSAMLNTAKVPTGEARYRFGCYHAPAPVLVLLTLHISPHSLAAQTAGQPESSTPGSQADEHP